MEIKKHTLNLLEELVASRSDRYTYILSNLEKSGFSPIPIELDGARFILVRFGKDLYSPKLGPTKVLAAHYDSMPGSPGANDNAAAVVQLLEAAPKLAKSPLPHNTLLLFTDREEVNVSSSPKKQGSFLLGEAFRKQGLKDMVFFNFDMCGKGDTVIVSEAAEQFLASRHKTHTALFQNIHSLREKLIDRLPRMVRGRFISLRTPFSDNLGFLLQGYPAIHLTLLPFKEAAAYKKDLDNLRDEITRKQKIDVLHNADTYRSRFTKIQPETWNLRHGSKDTIDTLSPEAFSLMEEVYSAVSKLDLSV
ncbi:MAG: M28 family peptidase [Spirochaetales bacterium]|nr:M28 family peptidase [Spirochaetales bacterium]